VPICGWFSAIFDTLDLKQTKALLDELTERGRLWSKRLSVNGRSVRECQAIARGRDRA
jgi:hypothetical protein